jgi:uncharacterized protein
MALAMIVMAAFYQASAGSGESLAAGALCSESWYRFIDQKVQTGDGQGHGPDIGSEEWKSVIEFKLGLRGQPNLPERESEAWCRRIDQIVREKEAPLRSDASPASAAGAAGPSYDCSKVETGSIEALICRDPELAALDRKLARVYAGASKKAVNEHPPVLKAEQRGWIKGRNECWKSDDKRGCVRDAYRYRIARLQAEYRLVPAKGPVRFVCNDNPVNEVVATFFQTDPPTLIAERGDSVSLMYLQPSASGAKYQGRNETFWEHQGEALVTWGVGAPQMRCRKAH